MVVIETFPRWCQTRPPPHGVAPTGTGYDLAEVDVSESSLDQWMLGENIVGRFKGAGG